MKIDYDKPVTVDRPKLAEGWYWIPNQNADDMEVCYVWADQSVRIHSAADCSGSETVGELVDNGVRFYPARLPKPARKGGKR